MVNPEYTSKTLLLAPERLLEPFPSDGQPFRNPAG